MTPVYDMPQCVVTNLFRCIHLHLTALFLPLTSIIRTNVPVDRYIHS
jgi:hypothetical protein